MIPSGSPTPIGGAQSISPVVFRSNSAILGSQGGLLPPQAAFSSVGPPRAQCNLNFLGHTSNISSLLNQTYGGGSISSLGGFQQGSVDTTAGSDPLSTAASDCGFTPSHSLFAPITNSGSSDQVQNSQLPTSSGNSMLPEQQQSQVKRLELQKLQHSQVSMLQSSVSHSQLQQHQLRQQQQQFQSIQGGLGGVRTVKLELQMLNDQIASQQQLQSLQNLGPVKLEPQQNQMGRRIQPVKLEDQHSDEAMLLQQQQLHILQMCGQSSQAATAKMKFLQPQRILQLQQQEHQELFKALPQQRCHLQQQFQLQNFPIRSAMRPVYEPGMCARRLTQYMYQQQHRPEDNNIEFWRKFVAEFFTPNAKKKWCVSFYGNSHQTNGVFPQNLLDVWHCEICNCKPGRGFETTVEVLPRLFKIKYDSGTLQELLYVDMPHEYENTSGQIVLDYAKAIQESVFEQLRVVRDGHLRLIFSSDLKICSWEFCARRHEELIPRRIIIPQLSQVGAAAQKYQVSAQKASTSSSSQDLQRNCNMFVASACQLAKTLEAPLVNDLGYTKRYVRCLQIAEVVNIMKDLIDYSQETGKGPMESLANFPCGISSLSGLPNSAQTTGEWQQLQQQITGQNLINDHSLPGTSMQPSASDCVASLNNSQSTASTLTSATTVVGLLCENSMNSGHESQMNNPSSPYSGTHVQIPSAGSSTTLPPAQFNPPSPFLSPTPSVNSPARIALQHTAQSKEANHESQRSVEKILQEIMNSSQYSREGSMASAGSMRSYMNNVIGLSSSLPSTNSLVGNAGVNNNAGVPGEGFGNFGAGVGLSTAATGIRVAVANNSGTLTGRVGLPLMPSDNSVNLQQQELANRLLNGLGAVNGFNDLQFNWKYP